MKARLEPPCKKSLFLFCFSGVIMSIRLFFLFGEQFSISIDHVNL